MTETERPLIDVARETAKRGTRAWVLSDMDYSSAYVAGYEDGRESVAAQRNAAFVDTLALANARVAEVEAEKATLEADEKIVSGMSYDAMKAVTAENATLRDRLAALAGKHAALLGAFAEVRDGE